MNLKLTLSVPPMRFKATMLGSSLGLLGLIALTALASAQSAKTVTRKPASIVAMPADMSQCQGCHAANFAGRTGFSPSLRVSGVLKQYNKSTFEKVMDTGITKLGTPVKQPMPVYHYKAPVSDKIYAYLKTLK